MQADSPIARKVEYAIKPRTLLIPPPNSQVERTRGCDMRPTRGKGEEEKGNLARGGGEEGSGDALRLFPCLSCRQRRWMLRDEIGAEMRGISGPFYNRVSQERAQKKIILIP